MGAPRSHQVSATLATAVEEEEQDGGEVGLGRDGVVAVHRGEEEAVVEINDPRMEDLYREFSQQNALAQIGRC